MTTRRLPKLCLAAAVLLGASLAFSACTSGQKPEPAASSAAPASSGDGSCPTKPINIVVSVDQWGDIVKALGGSCAAVKTVLASSSVDPHDYEPSPSDAATFSGAQLVVVNGADYDSWAAKLAATSAPTAPVVDAAGVTNTTNGANPHLWYSPSAVSVVADAVTRALAKLDPPAADYFATQRSAFTDSLKPYDGLIASIRSAASGKSYAASESVFDYMAHALGLVNKTPAGYQTASANGSDPSPADLEAFRRALIDRQVDVLIYNTQTQGSVPEQIRSSAEQAGVPVVEVTETIAPGATSFESWQVAQLTALAKALGVGV
jgi:zinc/manganese transport system substrate-binding protein